MFIFSIGPEVVSEGSFLFESGVFVEFLCGFVCFKDFKVDFMKVEMLECMGEDKIECFFSDSFEQLKEKVVAIKAVINKTL